jgi:hypothetical protein
MGDRGVALGSQSCRLGEIDAQLIALLLVAAGYFGELLLDVMFVHFRRYMTMCSPRVPLNISIDGLDADGLRVAERRKFLVASPL